MCGNSSTTDIEKNAPAENTPLHQQKEVLKLTEERWRVIISILKLMRWLLVPGLFVLGHWVLLVSPDIMLKLCPMLWTPSLKTPSSALPPIPTTRVQVFDLGVQADYFSKHCSNGTLSSACNDVLSKAGQLLGSTKPLTREQMLGERDFLAQLDAQRSVADRVLGFFSFINILMLVGIVGILCTVGPCIGYLVWKVCGPRLLELAKTFYEDVLIPVLKRLHEVGFFELVAYAIALMLSVEGTRYPKGADAGINVSLLGGLLFLPCWAYSTGLHMSAPGGDEVKFFVLSHVMVANILVPLAVVHQSQLIGFLAILAVYGSLGFMFLAFGFGFLIGFDSEVALVRCVAASVVLIVVFGSMRIAGVSSIWMQPFAVGAMCLGNVMYFLGLLIACGMVRRNKDNNYFMWQATMAVSLAAALLIGSVFAMPAMTNTACTFLVLWLMEKQLEVDWNHWAIVVIFFNCLGLIFISLWLNHHPEFILALFNASGVYV